MYKQGDNYPRKSKKINELFSVYKNRLIPPQSSVENEVLIVIKEILGFRLRKNEVEYRVVSRTLSIKASSIIKQEIKIKENEVLFELKNRLGERSCPKSIV